MWRRPVSVAWRQSTASRPPAVRSIATLVDGSSSWQRNDRRWRSRQHTHRLLYGIAQRRHFSFFGWRREGGDDATRGNAADGVTQDVGGASTLAQDVGGASTLTQDVGGASPLTQDMGGSPLLTQDIAGVSTSLPSSTHADGDMASLAAVDLASFGDSVVTALSTQSALEGAGIGPVVLMMRYIEAIHIYGGLPWWGSIVAGSLLVRVALSPLYFSSMKSGVMMRKLQPQTQKLQARMKWAKEVGDTHTHQATLKEMQEVFKKNNISPLKPLVGALVQLPIFISLIWAIRRMLDNAADFEGLATGGTAWFTDLVAYDPTFSLPIATAAINIMSVQLNQNIADSPMMTAKTAKNVFRFMSAAFVPLTAMLPAGMHLSFFVTACVMFTQVASTNVLAVRRFWGLPDEWPVAPPEQPNGAQQQAPSVSLFRGPQSQPPPPPPPPANTIDVDSTPVPPPPPGAAADQADAAAAATAPRLNAQQAVNKKKKKVVRRKKKRS